VVLAADRVASKRPQARKRESVDAAENLARRPLHQLVSILVNASKVDEYLTVAEIASELKLNQQTIRNWIDQGSLRAVRVGARRVRVLRSDLDRVLAEGATAAAVEDRAGGDPVGEVRRRLDPAVQRARDALAGDRKSELAAALSALADAAEQAIAILEQAASSPPPGTGGR
jgi:excisionase family DNA binding protein